MNCQKLEDLLVNAGIGKRVKITYVEERMIRGDKTHTVTGELYSISSHGIEVNNINDRNMDYRKLAYSAVTDFQFLSE